MRRPAFALSIGLVVFFCLSLTAQERVVLVGVATMKNEAARSVPGSQARDHLVRALNQEKPDKKLHLKVQGVPLQGMTPEDAAPEAAEKKCDYVVYTTLTELRAPGDLPQQRPGTVELNPNGVFRPRSTETATMNPEYRASVAYRLYRVGDPSPLAGAEFSNQQAMPEIDVVDGVMDILANRVYAEVKKNTHN